MKLLNKIFSRRNRYIWISISGIALVYLILRLFFFNSDPLIPMISSITDSYLLLIEKAASKILHFLGYDIVVSNHLVISDNAYLDGFVPEIRLKKWMLLFIFLIFFTKTSRIKKLLCFGGILIAHFLIVVMYTSVGAYIASTANKDFSYLSIPVTIGLLILVTILFLFFKKEKAAVLEALSKLKINTDLFRNGYVVYLTVCGFIILMNFLFEFFDYLPWINFLFNSARKILGLLGYQAVVKPFVLEGPNCSIAMLKGCLGFQTMLLFSVIVLITGRKNKYRWMYVTGGIILLNIVNIFRFVFLFIHLCKHGNYLLTMEVHDMYNLITYSFVFVLWVIWFEKFAKVSKRENRSDSEKGENDKNEIINNLL